MLLGRLKHNVASLKKPFSFLVVGGLGAGAYAVTCAILVQYFPSYKTEISIGVYSALIPFAFLGQRYFTFQASGYWPSEFVKYAFLQIASVILATSLLIKMVSGVPLYDLAVFLMINVFTAVISFTVCNTTIFGQGSR